MDDNARPLRVNIVDECLSKDITHMDWPAYSPDLNPIEHVQYGGYDHRLVTERVQIPRKTSSSEKEDGLSPVINSSLNGK
ncbi:hypothetical protein TNCV_3224111 [Trichonephila clavipes]|nr:hypothetical protein TNCV_3224111 [Trichonephila clavipes]